MKLRAISTLLLTLGLFTGCQDDDENLVIQCVEGTVVGRHCATPSGSYGYVINLTRPDSNARGWVDSVGNQYTFALTALNLPGNLRQPGKKVYFAAHEATEAEKAAIGARTAQCAAPPPLITLEFVQDKPCD